MNTFMVILIVNKAVTPEHLCHSVDIYLAIWCYHAEMDDFPHIVRFIVRNRDTGFAYAGVDCFLPKKWRDDFQDGKLSEPSEWCMEQLGPKNLEWKRLHNGALMFYFFRKKENAALFKLTWADFS